MLFCSIVKQFDYILKKNLLNQFRMSNYPCDNKWIAPRIIQFAAFTSFFSGKSAAAAAAVLRLQQQYPFESIQIVKLPVYTKFGYNKWITSRIIQFAAFSSRMSG